MWESLLSSFTLVAVSEMGDKTQLLAFSLAARFRRPWIILAGVFVATLLNHALAATAGAWAASRLDPRWMGTVVGVGFLAFGFWTLKPDRLEEDGETSHFGAFVTTTLLFFAAEMGDKTQFATIGLAARYADAATVTVGTTLGMMLTNGLAVFLGDRLAPRVQLPIVRWIAAGLFFVFAAVTLVLTWR